MNKKFLVATNNDGKLREFNAVLGELGIKCISLKEAGINISIPETEDTFLGNARLKAREIYKIAKIPTISDDSGLVVDALGGEPGVYSARYAGENADDNANIEKLLNNLKEIPENQRTARFKCVIYAVLDENTELSAEGVCEGRIISQKRGSNGFGYDPVFFVEAFKKTFAELTDSEKNSISHRGKALRGFVKCKM